MCFSSGLQGSLGMRREQKLACTSELSVQFSYWRQLSFRLKSLKLSLIIKSKTRTCICLSFALHLFVFLPSSIFKNIYF